MNTENNPITTEDVVDMDEISQQEAEVAETITDCAPEPDTTLVGDIPPPVVEDIVEDCDDEDDDDLITDDDDEDDE